MKNLRKNLKKNQKGFTLVEIIVVLVILAILAAASIPTMIGFVEDAKGKSEIANARAAYVAAQAIFTEEYAKGLDPKVEAKKLLDGYEITGSGDAKKFEQMVGKDLVGAKVKATDVASTGAPVTKVDGKIDKFQYLSNTTVANGYLVTITPGGDTVVEKGGALK